MPTDLQEHYFRQAKNCFFRWEEAGRVLVWDDGTTIAFREEIAAVMDRLAPGGLPPFNAIAVLLSACRGNWNLSRRVLNEALVELQFSRLRKLLPGRSEFDTAAARDIIAKLDAIHQYPEELRTDLHARCELAAMIFEGRSKREGWLDEEAGKNLAKQMASGLPKSLESDGGLEQAVAELPVAEDSAMVLATQADVLPAASMFVKRDALALLAALRSLQAGIDGITPETLQRRIKTGLEQEVLPAPESELERSESLIGQLLADEQLGGLATLARNLMALLTFPRQLSQPDVIAMGGVSDITNRGQLDQLMLSELAHDDLTLASRIALNEALYLHRETPPSPRATSRRVFVDTGLCMWGVPRLFATATALSMAEMADGHLDVSFCRYDGDQVVSADFSSREGIEDHLAQLTHDLIPTAALPDFFYSHPYDECEFVIVTERDVVADATFIQTLKSVLPCGPTFLISVDRNGNLTFSSISERGMKVLRTGKLDLTSILTEPTKKSQDLAVSRELPILFSQKSFPLRTYQQPIAERSFRYSAGLVSITGDGRLMLWDSDDCGARQLSDQLGKGRLFWYGLDPHGVPVMVWGFASESALKLIRIHDDDYVAITNLTYSGVPVKVSGHLGNVFVEFSDRWEMFRSGRSTCVSTRGKEGRSSTIESNNQFPQLSAAARFCRFHSNGKAVQWLALTAVSGELKLEPVPVPNPERVKWLFDRRGQGVVAVGHSGTVQRLYGDERRIPARGEMVAVSIDGACFVQEGTSRDPGCLVQTDQLQSTPCGRPGADPFVLDATKVCRSRTLRRKFQSVCVNDSRLVLCSPKSDRFYIDHDRGIVLRPCRNETGMDEIRFQPMPSPDGCLYSLQAATWPCGSRAILDSRGILHLMSWDASVPQISLILYEGRMAGWCEESGAFGGGYFQLSGPGTSPQHDSEIYGTSIGEFIRCVNLN